MRFGQITIIGVGLIGGSIGLAAKARNIAVRLVGVDCNPASLEKAEQLDVVDSGTTNLPDGVSEADLIVVCTPVDTIASVILDAVPHVRPGALFTDGGSTKGNIVRELVHCLPGHIHYVPAHPLAGAEKSGVENARADLFVDRVTILTPGRFGPEVDTITAFWRALGSRVVQMDADEHDRILAFTSHLPHVIASAMASVTATDWLTLTAGGFRDVTRIAAGDPRLWAAILEVNRANILTALAAFTNRLAECRQFLEVQDRAGLVQWLVEGKQVRDALGT